MKIYTIKLNFIKIKKLIISYYKYKLFIVILFTINIFIKYKVEN